MSNLSKVKPYGEYDRALQKFFPTKTAKKEYMKIHGLAHDGSMESDEHRTNRLAEQINEDRRKRGQKPKTVQELVGNAKKVPKKIYFFT